MQGHALGVDLGTSNTVAVLRWPDGRTRPLLFDAQPLLPSGVLLDEAGRLHVGRDAQRLAQADPARYEPNPKRRVDDVAVLLGDREVQIADLLAAVLTAVAHAAVEAVGFLPPAALTHPAAWGARRRDLLATAVVRAGWPAVGEGGTRLVPEPVAAARYFAQVLRRPVPVGSALAVFDFGGGTLDVAVVRNEGGRFAVMGTGGVAELGGLDLDAALVDHIGRVIAGADPAAWQRLAQPASVTALRDRTRFWDDVRGAKEMLSRAAVAPIAVPGVDQHVHLTREELERLTSPLLRRGMLATAEVIAAAGLRPDQLAGLFLVGGSSRVPMVARMLHSELGIAPTVLEQPELPVAEGALAELAPASVAVPAGVAAVPGVAVPGMGRASGAGGSAVDAPASGAPASGVPASRAPVSGGPVSGGTVSGAPVSGGGFAPAPVSPPAAPSPASRPVAAPAVAPSGPVPMSRGGGSRRRLWWAALAAAVVVVLAVASTAVVWYLRRGPTQVEFQTFADLGKPIAAGDERPPYVWTRLVGDRAYLAYQGEDDRLWVIAVDASSGEELWRQPSEKTSEAWASLRAVPGAVVVLADDTARDQPREISVLDPGSGRRLWGRNIYGEDGTFVFEDRLVLVDRATDKVVGLDLRTGDVEWEHPTPKDQFDSAETAVYPVSTPADVDGPAYDDGTLIAPAREDQRLVQISGDRSARVIDVESGKIFKSRKNVAAPDEWVLAHDGRLLVASSADGNLFSYDLETLGQPRSVYSAVDQQHRVIALAPCGSGRACLLEQASFDAKTNELISVDLDKGEERWREKAADFETLVPVGEHVMVLRDSPNYTTAVYDAGGGRTTTRDGVGVRLNGGSMLFFGKYLTTSVDDPSVAGLTVGSAQPVELGPLKGVRTASCSWNTELIACAGDTDFRIRRFAKG